MRGPRRALSPVQAIDVIPIARPRDRNQAMATSKQLKVPPPLPNRPNRFEPFESLLSDGETSLLSLDPGWAKAALALRTGQRLGHAPDNIRMRSLESVYGQIGVFRARFERGDTLALLHAISECAEENVPLPTWLAEAFRFAITKFLQPGGPMSLDDVFYSSSLPTGTPKKAAAARQDWQLGDRLWRDLWDLLLKDESITSIDSGVARLLSKAAYGVAKTKAKALIERMDANQSDFLESGNSLSRFLEKRRKQMK